jgi:HEAT repeat protein
LLDGPVWAQEDAGSLLKSGLQQVRAGNYKEGISTLRKALAADPSNEEVMQALGRAEYEALLAIMASGEEGRSVVSAILSRAMPILPSEAFDNAKIAELVKSAVEDENEAVRFEAASELSRIYGEFAVPGLLAYLKSKNTDQRIQAHIVLQNRLGRDAVLPLNEALSSSDAGVRRLVAIELGNIGDMRSLPAVAAAASGDEDEGVRAKAAESLEKLVARYSWAAGMSASELYLRLAQMYYDGNYRVLARSDKPIVVWRWEGGLKRFPITRHLYVLKLAEEASYDALAADENNMAAASMLARVLASERIAMAAVSAMSDDEAGATSADRDRIEGLMTGLGWNTLAQALSESLARDDYGTAASLLGVMHNVYAGADFTDGHPVVQATTSKSALVRMAAAEAVLRFNGMRRIGSWPNPGAFMGLVATATGEIIPRNILVVDAQDGRRNKMLDELDKAKYVVFSAGQGSDGFVRGVRLAGIDMIVMSTDLGDMEALALIAKLKNEDATKNVPLVLVGTANDVSNDEWRNLYKDKVNGISPIPEGPGIPTEEFIKVVMASFTEEAVGAKARYAASARILDALANTDTSNGLFEWESLTDSLLALLGADLPDDVPVRLNAINALGNVRDSAAVQPLADYFAAESDAAHKAAAGHAIAKICRAHGVTLADDAFAKLLDGTRNADMGVANAAFAALGSSQLTPAQMRTVAIRNRPTTEGAGEGGGDEGDAGMDDSEDSGDSEEEDEE